MQSGTSQFLYTWTTYQECLSCVGDVDVHLWWEFEAAGNSADIVAVIVWVDHEIITCDCQQSRVKLARFECLPGL